MKPENYIALKDLSDHHENHPDTIPVFGKISCIEGELVGEIVGYCDMFGNPVEGPPVEKKIYH